ncbi:divergent polysaccharide deacetylase family protein [Sediminicoccus sp. KRV36]|uniref:divergent polysaccharide deacetylase family protein n=1 Tax=Sediminicoccus sp. KRV36 TaxID=3133721 RepID=UPI00200F0C04|nr:divergent polysaccharide deacetylase family protein [Sediminicoccus rosea]UPY36987.1 divergent polysaccharide deacetylase family protein [Sediminicoccus rosea]
MSEGVSQQGRGWFWLGVFWLVVLAGLGGGGVTLAILGPPPAAPIHLVQNAAERPAAVETPAPSVPPLRGVPENLVRHLDPALVEYTAMGAMPRIGPDGRMPMRVYARPFDRQDPRPRVALILGGIGLRTSLSEEAIRTLPPQIGLAFTPYALNPASLIEQARDRGFETLLALPMEPTGFPMNDPGHRALLTGLSAGENAQRLDWLLARYPGHVGAVGALTSMRGERFAALAEPFAQMQLALNARGLLYFDARPGAPNPERAWGLAVDVVVDEPHTRGEMDQRLALLERLARERGGALGYLGEVTPVSLQRLSEWFARLDSRGVVLAPVTAMMRRPEMAAR